MSTVFLDGIRGLAALYVLIGHARWLLWEGYSVRFLATQEEYTIFEKLLVYFFSLFRYGHEAVLLFFVLSGFVIHLRYSKSLKANRSAGFDLSNYLKRRILRIFPPLALALVITFILDQVGLCLQLPIYEHTTKYATINQNISTDHNLSTVLGNLLFVMDIYTPVFGTNGSLWSLAYEWWFYLLYPAFFLLIRKSQLLATGAVIVLYFVINWLPLEMKLATKVFSLFPVWWFGVLLAEIYTGRSRIKFKHLMPLALLILIVPFHTLSTPLRAFNQILWGLAFSGIFAMLFHLQSKGFKLSFLNNLKPLGTISYSLYVTHLPVIVLLSALILSISGNNFLPSSQWFIVLGILIAFIIAYPAYLLAEKPFLKKKDRISHPIKENNA